MWEGWSKPFRARTVSSDGNHKPRVPVTLSTGLAWYVRLWLKSSDHVDLPLVSRQWLQEEGELKSWLRRCGRPQDLDAPLGPRNRPVTAVPRSAICPKEDAEEGLVIMTICPSTVEIEHGFDGGRSQTDRRALDTAARRNVRRER